MSTGSEQALSIEQREALESDLTALRIVELERNPVTGDFDADHLREINRRIFQDLPRAGLIDVRPGEYRSPVPDGKDWLKNRVLTGPGTARGSSYLVAYSAMDAMARTRIDAALAHAKPARWKNLPTTAFVSRMADLYTELDYLHPFPDGNSRTLRSFTRQLAHHAGFDLDWARFATARAGRDLLYVARDLGVNRIARRHVSSEHTLRHIIGTIERIKSNPTLEQLLAQIVRPERAIAFEQLNATEAQKHFPELAPSYDALQAASSYFAVKLAGHDAAQAEALKLAARNIQTHLDQGEIHGMMKHARARAPSERGRGK